MPSKSNAPLDELNREGKRIQELIARIDEVPDPSSRADARGCLESLLRFYGQGLARILELVEEAGPEGREVYDGLINDAAVRGLLLIHGLASGSARDAAPRGARQNPALYGKPWRQCRAFESGRRRREARPARPLQDLPILSRDHGTCDSGRHRRGMPGPDGLRGRGSRAGAADAPMLHVPNGAPAWTEIAEAKDLDEGAMISVHPADFPLIVCKHNSQLYAYRDHCPACNMPLHLGAFEDGVLVCSLGHRYDVQRAGSFARPDFASPRSSSVARPRWRREGRARQGKQ